MVSGSRSGDPSKSRKSSGEQASDVSGMLAHKINRLRKNIQAERVTTVRKKLENNRKRLENHLSQLVSSPVSETDVSRMGSSAVGNMLSTRIENPLCILTGPSLGSGDKDDADNQEVAIPVCAKLPLVDKIPPYTTWSFLSRVIEMLDNKQTCGICLRYPSSVTVDQDLVLVNDIRIVIKNTFITDYLTINQRMAEDQSVVGRRQIYYDREQGSEALIYTDSEEEIGDQEEEKHEFSKAEDRILRMAVEEFEPSEELLNTLAQFIDGSTAEIQERCSMLQKNSGEKCNDAATKSGEVANDKGIDLQKSLSASLDSLDNLFCRRCLVFDCRLHGYSQSLIWPSEKHLFSSESEEQRKPCGDHCYLQINKNTENTAGGSFSTERTISEDKGESEVSVNTGASGKRKFSKQTSLVPESSTLVSDHLQGSCSKKQKKMFLPDTVATAIESAKDYDNSHDKTADLEVGSSNEVELVMTSTKAALNVVDRQAEEGIKSSCQWKPLEKELYLKGVEIFGKNSCLIARNLLSGLKTCMEVSKYMNDGGSALSQRGFAAGSLLGDNEAGVDHEGRGMSSRSRLLRKRGKTRRLKYSRKSAGYPGTWRHIGDGKDEPCRQYTPCGCESQCGKNCPCIDSKTCCEKYCGCAKSCKNRFRGCHCAKSQCRSRQCPCFAAQRECDPDVCRNCWVSCGDGTLGEPPRRGDGQCGNMRLLLRQQQRILLGKSDVAGWGAFSKNPVDKNEILGEYTGELISHREADKRGKIYDRTNSSFLFDLNDQYVLDAYRKGDKLKFANHSKNPNCYARVMLVAGDHRVGIFAKKPIEASEELFYDYHYKPDARPVWARKLEGMKGDESTTPQGRAKKHQSQS